jgi:hypothetical protein
LGDDRSAVRLRRAASSALRVNGAVVSTIGRAMAPFPGARRARMAVGHASGAGPAALGCAGDVPRAGGPDEAEEDASR